MVKYILKEKVSPVSKLRIGAGISAGTLGRGGVTFVVLIGLLSSSYSKALRDTSAVVEFGNPTDIEEGRG
jgi:hypothetical protein